MGLDPGNVALHAAYIIQASECVEVSYLKALRRDTDSPAVLLLDPLDLSARRIVAAASRTDPVAFIEEARRRGGYPISTPGVPQPAPRVRSPPTAPRSPLRSGCLSTAAGRT